MRAFVSEGALCMLRSVPDPLFQPFFLGPWRLPNRIVMAPMARDRSGANRVPGPLDAEYFRQRASAGLVIAGGAQVSPQGIGALGVPGIHTREQMQGWRGVTQTVHGEGGRIFLQLWHAGRLSHPDLLEGRLPVAPSESAAPGEVMTPDGFQAFPVPRALETDELPGVVEEYARAAALAKAAGFDGVEVHAANGHLLDQFLRDGSNLREDAYGGTVSGRMRLLLETLEAVATVWDWESIGVRLSPENPANGMSDSDPETHFLEIASELGRRGLGYLHLVENGDARAETGGDADIFSDSGPSPLIARMRERFGGSVMLCGGLTAKSARAALESGAADLAAFGRVFISNPDLPLRIRENAELNQLDRGTLFGTGPEGFTDYPSLTSQTSSHPHT